MNPFDMVKNFHQIQAAVQAAQQRIQAIVVEGNAGGGMVRVKMDGSFKIRQVQIDPKLLTPEDGEMVADLVTGAAADAHRQVAELVQKEMMAASGGLPLPNLFGGGT